MPTPDLLSRLIDLRKSVGLTQVQLAAKLGVSSGAIGLYETRARRLPLTTAQRWAEVCGASLEHVIARPDQLPELALSHEETVVVQLYRTLAEEDRRLLRDFARGLNGGDRALRHMIALQIPVLLSSVPSEELDEYRALTKSS